MYSLRGAPSHHGAQTKFKHYAIYVAKAVKFGTTLEVVGKSATGFEVPEAMLEKLESGKRPPVVVQIGSYSYRSTVASMGGRYMIPVNAEHRKGAGISGGEQLRVLLTLDDKPREVVVPSDFAAAMSEVGVRARFDALAYTHRKEYVRSIEDAKSDETRIRRIDKAVEKLSGSSG